MFVPQNLNLYVPGIFYEFFQIHFTVVKCPLGLALGSFKSGLQLGFRMDQAHALAASTGCSLDHYGKTDLWGQLCGFNICETSGRTGNTRHPGGLDSLASTSFRSHGFHRRG